jgi:sugar transferase (PEP-CTERM/EpsH1 system associated)
MKEILFLAHRIPYPPNKGDKIRSFNLLKYLAESYRVSLGAFVDDPKDWQYRSDVEHYCAETCLLPLSPTLAKIRSLTGLLTGEPLTVPYYTDRRMQAWVDKVLTRNIQAILVFSSAMAQYVEKRDSVRRIIDFVDVDSDKWRQYAEKKSGPAKWIYRREADRLFTYDRRIANAFDRSIFVSEQEAQLFTGLVPETSERVRAVENGVDTVYFRDSGDFPNPYPPDTDILVFTGAMDYWANVDAVTWFADEVFPAIRSRVPTARFFVVGARPAEAVRGLERREGITVTGAVRDIRPYLSHARLAVAPLRIARGIQNKVLEAMAMGRPVLASPAAMEGIDASGSLDAVTAEGPEAWSDAAVQMLGSGGVPAVSVKNRDFVEQRYSWKNSLSCLGTLLDTV